MNNGKQRRAFTRWTAHVMIAAFFLCMFVPSVIQARQDAEDTREAVAGNVKKGIMSALSKIDTDLAASAGRLSKTGVEGEEARSVIRDLCKGVPFAVDCAAVDKTGKMVIVEPREYRKFEGKDISGQEHIKMLLKTKMPSISKVFRSVEGIDAADFEYPVFSTTGEYMGSVSVLFRPEKLINGVVNDVARDAPFEIWAMQRDGRIVYDPDTDEVGRMLFEDPLYQPYTTLIALGKRIVKQKEGSGEYIFLARGHKEPIKKIATWETVGFRGTQWRIVAVRIEHGERGERAIRMGLVTKPGSAQNVCAERFKTLLEKRSPYRVIIYDNGSLGTETAILKQIRSGTIQMGVITSGPIDEFVPEVRVIEYPFLFKDYRDVDTVLDGPLGKKLLGTLKRGGFEGIAFSENGFRNLTNNKWPVHAVSDVKGLRIRVMESEFHKALWKLLGAIPVPMGWPINKQLKEGVIDGQENPLSVIWTYKLFNEQKYLTMTGHVYSAHIDMANLRWFESLPENDRRLIRQCMEEAATYQKQWNRDNVEGFLKSLKEAGMVVDEKPDLASFRKKVANIQELDIYKDPGVKALLREFLARPAMP